MATVDELLPRARTPRHYRELVDDPRADQAVLRELAAGPYPFVRVAVAACPRADAATLAAVDLGGLDAWDRNGALASLAAHPHADRAVLLTVLREVTALLDGRGERPFATALALAARPELTDDEIRALTNRPGASRRMIRGVLDRLAARRAV